MTTEQFKILCRAYWPNCRFFEGHLSLLCFPSYGVDLSLQLYNGNVFGYTNVKMFQETNEIKPEKIIREMYNEYRTV